MTSQQKVWALVGIIGAVAIVYYVRGRVKSKGKSAGNPAPATGGGPQGGAPTQPLVDLGADIPKGPPDAPSNKTLPIAPGVPNSLIGADTSQPVGSGTVIAENLGPLQS